MGIWERNIRFTTSEYTLGIEDGFSKEAPQLEFEDYTLPDIVGKRGYPYIMQHGEKRYISRGDVIMESTNPRMRIVVSQDHMLEDFVHIEKVRSGERYRIR